MSLGLSDNLCRHKLKFGSDKYNILYAKSVKVMGAREKAGKVEFSEILAEEVEAKIKEAVVISMGSEISDTDMMNTIAPNLTALVGEVIVGRLIAHGGRLMNLTKQLGSTFQILEARLMIVEGKDLGRSGGSAKGKPKIEAYDNYLKNETGALIAAAKSYNPSADSLMDINKN
ncbi:hypothetical protein ACFE04_019079 [Oxalis oulophora]